jgi:hypothetical protein
VRLFSFVVFNATRDPSGILLPSILDRSAGWPSGAGPAFLLHFAGSGGGDLAGTYAHTAQGSVPQCQSKSTVNEGFTAARQYPRWGRSMSDWQTEKAERNRKSFARLSRSLPAVFPPAVLARALDRPFIPPTPRLAIESYWRAHPIRADRLARALAARTGPPIGWTWRLSLSSKDGLPPTFRTPPAPYRERAYSLGPGACCICGQPVYRLGWHTDLWNVGPNKNAVWHCACVVAWQFWNAPNSEAALLRRLQGRRCGQTGGRLWKNAEVDHRVPLFRVWGEHRDLRWPKLLDFWGLPNLQAINRDVHAAKCAIEARDRRAARLLETELG